MAETLAGLPSTETSSWSAHGIRLIGSGLASADRDHNYAHPVVMGLRRPPSGRHTRLARRLGGRWRRHGPALRNVPEGVEDSAFEVVRAQAVLSSR